MKVLIGIPAYNEGGNIKILLDNLSKACSKMDHSCSILVVSSGSTDETNEIVRTYMRNGDNVSLVTEKERRGKVSALNLLLDEARGYDIMLYLGADNIPADSVLNRMCEAFNDPSVGIVGSHPVPVDDPNTFWGWAYHTMWGIHHLTSLEYPKISGELCAIRPNIVKELPPGIINDDMYLQMLVEQRGYRVIYLPDAYVFLKGASNIQDFIRQRRRVLIGHIQLEFLMGKKIPTMNVLKNLSLLRKAKPKTSLVRGWLWTLAFLFFYMIAQILSKFDFLMRNLPYKWEIAETTKTLRYGLSKP